MSSKPVPRDMIPGAPGTGRILIESLLLGLGVTIIAGWSMLTLFDRWYESLRFNPDFSTNGLQWLLLAMTIVVLPVQLAVNTFVIGIMLPIFFHRKVLRVGIPINPWIATGLAVSVAALAALAMIGWSGTHVILSMVAGPWLIAIAIAVPLFVRRLNRTLEPATEV